MFYCQMWNFFPTTWCISEQLVDYRKSITAAQLCRALQRIKKSSSQSECAATTTILAAYHSSYRLQTCEEFRSLLAHNLMLMISCSRSVRTWINQSLDIYHPVRYGLKILAFSLFPGQIQYLVWVRFESRQKLFFILFLRTYDRLTTVLRSVTF
jgi:hypothetical protein